MKMPEKVRISVDLIKELRSNLSDKPQRVVDLAPKIGTTEAFLLQVVRHLGKDGLVNVIRGPGGGLTATINPTNMLKVCQCLGYFNETNSATKASAKVENKMREFLSGVEV